MTIAVHPVFVTDRNGIKGRSADGKFDFAYTRTEFDFANQIYASIGLSVIGTKPSYVQNRDVEFPILAGIGEIQNGVPQGEEFKVALNGRDANLNTIDVFYVGAIDLSENESDNEWLLGKTNLLTPELQESLATLVKLEKMPHGYAGILMSHVRRRLRRSNDGLGIEVFNSHTPIPPDTFAHEIGHYLLNSALEDTHWHVPSRDNGTHILGERVASAPGLIPNPRNLMADPKTEPIGPGVVGFSVLDQSRIQAGQAVTKLGDNDVANSAPIQVGRHVGLIGGISLLDGDIVTRRKVNNLWQPIQTNADGSPKPDTTQPIAMHRSAVIQRASTATVKANGERVDFAWLETNTITEKIIGADGGDTTQVKNTDYLVWEIAPVHWSGSVKEAPDGPKEWMADVGRVFKDRPFAYENEWFNYVDVVSNIARYADNDFDTSSQRWSAKFSALDYEVLFCESADAEQDCNGTPNGWRKGTLEKVFADGWTTASKADDFVARWKAPDKRNGEIFEARKVAIRPKKFTRTADDNAIWDGNSQIDAIIAGKIVRNKTNTGTRVQMGGTYSSPTYTFYVDYAITNEENPQDLGGPFTVSLYGSYDGVTPAVLIASQQVSSPSASDTVTFSELDLAEFEGFASIVSVIDPDHEQLESIYEDNVSKSDIVATGFGIEVAAVASLSAPSGFEFDGDFFYAVNVGGSTPTSSPVLYRLTTGGAVDDTWILSGTGVSGDRDWEDLAIYDAAEKLYIADIGASDGRSNIRVLEMPLALGDCSGVLTYTTGSPDECQFRASTYTWPTSFPYGGNTYEFGSNAPDAKTLLIDPEGGLPYIITTSGTGSLDASLVFSDRAAPYGELDLVAVLPFEGVLGGDVLAPFGSGAGVMLKTQDKAYLYPSIRPPSYLADLFQDGAGPWELPYDPTQESGDIAADLYGNGFYMLGSEGYGTNPTQYPIWHSEPSPPLMGMEFAANGTDFTFTYSLAAAYSRPFHVSVYRSTDGLNPSLLTPVGRRVISGSELGQGTYTVAIDVTNASDSGDYKLIAMVGNMRIPFSGGAFRSQTGALHIGGTNSSDVIAVDTDSLGEDILVAVNDDVFTYLDGVASISQVVVRGHDGADRVAVNVNESATVYGGAGDDEIDGGLGAGEINGGDGNDRLIAGLNTSLMSGAIGSDVYVFGTFEDNKTVSVGESSTNGEDEYDTLDFSGHDVAVGVDLVGGTNYDDVSSKLTVNFSWEHIENVIGTVFDDVITGNHLNNYLSGGSGADTYRFVDHAGGTLGSDTIDEFAEIDGDTLDFSALTSTILGSSGITIDLSSYDEQNVAGTNGSGLKLTLTNPLGVDNVIGTTRPDSITGNDGDNILEGGVENDTLSGGAGNDVYVYSGNGALNIDTIVEADAVDSDTLDFSGYTVGAGSTGIAVDLLVTDFQVVSSNLGFYLSSASGIESVIGTARNDSIRGNARPNRIEGGLGDDTLFGHRGDDVYVFARETGQHLGLDVIQEFGNVDHDTLDFSVVENARLEVDLSDSTNQDTLFEYNGTWVVKGQLRLESVGYGTGTTIEGVIGTADDDLIIGNLRPNRLEGGVGDDTLWGYNGQDTLGVGGDDTYVFARIDQEDLGDDEIRESADSGYDVLDFSGMNVAVDVDLFVTGEFQSVVEVENVLRIALTTGDSMAGGDSIEHVIGSPYDDTIRGNSLANHLRGGLGDDTIEGRGEDDILDGGEGSDEYEFRYSSMLGGLGDDLLREGEAADSDTLDFSEFPQGVVVDLTTGVTVSGVLTLALNRADGVENVVGTASGDVLLGNDRPNLLDGGAGNDSSILGFAGDDTLIGGEGDDYLDGGEGDDVYVFARGTSQNLGSDLVGEAADKGGDTLDFSEFLISSGTVVINLNTTSPTTVHSGGLSLTLSSATALDNVVGSPGADSIQGNNLANVLEGGEGNDTLSGGTGDDVYRFARLDEEDNLGVDVINDSGGFDAIDLSEIGVAVDVTASAGAVVDAFDYTVSTGTIEKLIGGALDDVLTGDNVWLVGGPGSDALIGGSGNETLEGGEGDDFLLGGDGDDVYRFRRQLYEDLGVDRVFEEVGEGTDLLDFADFGDALFIDLALNTQQRVADRALELLLLQDDDTTRSDVENVTGSDFDDVLVGNELGNHLFGGAGDDTLEGGEGNDSLEGGLGDDTYSFAQASTEDLGDDTVSEAAHRDFDLLDFSGFKSGVNVNLTASGMNNVDPTNGDLSLNFGGGEYSIEGLIGTDYADTLTGNKRPNWLEGGKGDDTLSGDLGDDRYVFRVFGSDNLGTDVIQNEVQYGGRDVIDFADFLPSDGLGVNGTSGFNLGTLSGSTAQTLHSQLSIRLHTTAVYLESVVGTPFADKLIGNNYANVLVGGNGNDTLEGGLGNDTLVGDGGDDSLVGGDANDTYVFDRTETDDLGHDTLVETASAYAETLDFSLFGEGVAINLGIGSTEQTIAEEKLILTLSSGTAFDNVIGTPFADTIRGNGSNNLLAGGDGDDTYVFARSTDSEQLGSDTITDMDGNDTLDFGAFGEGVFVSLYNGVPQSTNQFQVNRVGSSELTLQVPANQIENVIGSSGDDDINGIGGGLILGGDGDDTLNAIGDDATLVGGDGNDLLNGDNYRLTLEGGGGDDILNGEAGDTTYVFKRESTDYDLGHDEIIGEAANTGTDTFDFSEFAGSIDLDLNGGTGVVVVSGKLLLTFGSAIIENVIATAGADEITGNTRPNLILGGDGNDTITGGDGDDTLIGEEGDDSLLGGDGSDVLEGGIGNDALVGGDGNDEYVFGQIDGENLGSDSLTETTNGGTNDALMFNDFGSGVEVYLSESGNGPIVGHSKLTLTLVNADTIERLEGSNFDDVLVADAPALSVLYGHAGNDILIAGDGDNASLYGGSGDDYLVNGDAGSTTMYGEEGDDELVGGNHPADLYGGSGDDQLSSGTSGIVDDGAGHDIVDEVPDSDPSVGATVEPTAISLVLDPSTEVERGAALELALSGVSDADGIVLYALYYWDADDDGELNLEFDRLVGSDVVNGIEVTSEVSISTAGLPVGEARFFARVVDSHGLFSEIYEATIEVVDAPPRISQVLVSSTEWVPEFYTALGNTTGYAVPSGTFELRTLPWMNLNRIHIRFTEDVVVQAEDFQLFGVNLSEYTVAAFSYDAATFTATWTLDSFIAVDKLRIYLSDDITDLNGNHLDGEWVSYPTSGWSTFPSGNGTEGGNFSFRFNVLPGDVNGLFSPYTVSSTDVTAVSSKRGWAVGAASYSYRADLDGNGIIDEVDYILVMQYNPSSLPSGEPYEP